MLSRTLSAKAATSSPRWLALTLIWPLTTCVPSCGAPPVTVVQQVQCLHQPPPRMSLRVAMGILPDSPCPTGYVCLTNEGGISLGQWIGAVSDWMTAAYAACGPVDPAPAPAPDTSSSGASPLGSGLAGVTSAADAGPRGRD
jgi:hypothetical protein